MGWDALHGQCGQYLGNMPAVCMQTGAAVVAHMHHFGPAVPLPFAIYL
jgi:hypothetical protein